MGKGKPADAKAVFHDLIPVRPASEVPFLNRPSARAMKFRGIREGLMQKRKPLASSSMLLAALILSGQDIAVADKGGAALNPASTPNANLGLGAIPNFRTNVGLPAVAMPPKAGTGSTPIGGSGPGQNEGKGASAEMDPPGATRSASSAGLTPPGQSNQSNQGASNDNKSGAAKEKRAASTATASDAASGPAVSLDQLPTCR